MWRKKKRATPQKEISMNVLSSDHFSPLVTNGISCLESRHNITCGHDLMEIQRLRESLNSFMQDNALGGPLYAYGTASWAPPLIRALMHIMATPLGII